MRHRKSGRKLGRTSAHRRAMFRNMSASLIQHQLIRTTLPRAMELRRVVEPLITLAATDSVANRRLAFARLGDKAAVGKLFSHLGPHFKERPGGYLRILKCGLRTGDRAQMAFVELLAPPLRAAPASAKTGAAKTGAAKGKTTKTAPAKTEAAKTAATKAGAAGEGAAGAD